MRWFRLACATCVTFVLMAATAAASSQGGYVLSTGSTGSGYAPTFTGAGHG